MSRAGRRYEVWVDHDLGPILLSHRDRTDWCYATARKHAREYQLAHGFIAHIKEVE